MHKYFTYLIMVGGMIVNHKFNSLVDTLVLHLCHDEINLISYLLFVVVVDVVVIFRLIRIQRLVYPLTLSFIPNMMLLKGFHIHLSL